MYYGEPGSGKTTLTKKAYEFSSGKRNQRERFLYTGDREGWEYVGELKL